MSDVMEEDLASLLNLAGGAAIERFDDELVRVLANILDINTSLGKRQIQLTVKIQPTDMKRNLCKIDFTVTSKCLPAMQVSTQLHVGFDPKRGPVAVEYNPEQLRLFQKPNPDPEKIINFQQAKGE